MATRTTTPHLRRFTAGRSSPAPAWYPRLALAWCLLLPVAGCGMLLHGCASGHDSSLVPPGPSPAGMAVRVLDVAGHPVTVEVADTDPLRHMGLSFRERLPWDQGMLFVFPEDGTWSFWMKDAGLPLSIAFIRADGEITQIEDMQPFTTESHPSREPVIYALEMNQGWFEHAGVQVSASAGGRVQGLDGLEGK